MKPFSIVITGASRPELWYADKVGQAFEVSSCDTSEDAEPLFYVRYFEAGVPDWVDWSVMWDDCELAPQPEAAELALLRRVAEAADVFFNEITDSDVYLKIIQARSWEELHDVMAAWKAGQK